MRRIAEEGRSQRRRRRRTKERDAQRGKGGMSRASIWKQPDGGGDRPRDGRNEKQRVMRRQHGARRTRPGVKPQRRARGGETPADGDDDQRGGETPVILRRTFECPGGGDQRQAEPVEVASAPMRRAKMPVKKAGAYMATTCQEIALKPTGTPMPQPAMAPGAATMAAVMPNHASPAIRLGPTKARQSGGATVCAAAAGQSRGPAPWQNRQHQHENLRERGGQRRGREERSRRVYRHGIGQRRTGQIRQARRCRTR